MAEQTCAWCTLDKSANDFVLYMTAMIRLSIHAT